MSALTTFEKYRGDRAGNYCTLPTVEVEILPDVHHCVTCGEQVTFNPTTGFGGSWGHVEETGLVAEGPHPARPRVRCGYCHSEAEAEFVHSAYSDETRCSRCGGVTGFGVGD